jgi:hypothetical protein
MTETYVVVPADKASLIQFHGTKEQVQKYLGIKKFYKPQMDVMNYIMPKFFKGCVKSNVVHADYEKRLIVERVLI